MARAGPAWLLLLGVWVRLGCRGAGLEGPARARSPRAVPRSLLPGPAPACLEMPPGTGWERGRLGGTLRLQERLRGALFLPRSWQNLSRRVRWQEPARGGCLRSLAGCMHALLAQLLQGFPPWKRSPASGEWGGAGCIGRGCKGILLLHSLSPCTCLSAWVGWGCFHLPSRNCTSLIIFFFLDLPCYRFLS